ncbi:glycosyltransferase family 4 protein, partial [candidate division WOR-3 bacterium]|nr:glycosyltransferase family 4 protein [candidate division WOR-3 bacterium]
RGHSVTLVAERFGGSAEHELLDGIRVLRFGGKWTFNFAVCRKVARLADDGRYDVVIDDLNKIPFYSPWFTRKPVLAILMHLFRGSIFRETLPPMAAYVWLTETMIPLAYRRCRFAVLSGSSKQDTVKVGIDPAQIAVIPPGTDFDRFKPDAAVAREPVVLHVGRLKRYKSADHLLRAAQLLKERGVRFTTVVVGDGDDRPRLEALAARLGLGDAVRFTGYIPEEEKVNWYRRAGVLVENSVKEGWGLIVMEANGCGTPSIVARSPGLVDSSEDGVNGLMYDYGDVPALAERIERLLGDEPLRGKLGRQAVDWARQWTWDAAADRMEAVIEQTMAEGR